MFYTVDVRQRWTKIAFNFVVWGKAALKANGQGCSSVIKLSGLSGGEEHSKWNLLVNNAANT